MIADLARLLYWFNPLVWMTTRALRYERERACDDYYVHAGSRRHQGDAQGDHMAAERKYLEDRVPSRNRCRK